MDQPDHVVIGMHFARLTHCSREHDSENPGHHRHKRQALHVHTDSIILTSRTMFYFVHLTRSVRDLGKRRCTSLGVTENKRNGSDVSTVT